MGNFGCAAKRAVELVHDGIAENPKIAWNMGLKEFTRSESTLTKSCPRGAFLGLCEEGIIVGIPAGKYTRSITNKAYAVKAVEILRKSQQNISQSELWKMVAPHRTSPQDGQMDVVQSLWEQGFISNDLVVSREGDGF